MPYTVQLTTYCTAVIVPRMADMKTSKRSKKAPPSETSERTAGTLLTRNVPPEVMAWLDARVEQHRAELAAKATDALTRRFAGAYSRNDLIVDLLTDAMKDSKRAES